MSRHSLSIVEICQSADRTADVGLFGRLFPSIGARRMHRAVGHFTHLIYAIDERALRHWSPGERNVIEGAIQTAIKNTEAYLETPASRRSQRLAQHLVEYIYRLNVAIEGIAMGLSADPGRRPFGWQERRRTT